MKVSNILTVTAGGATIDAGGLTVTAGNVVAGTDGVADGVTFYSDAEGNTLVWDDTTAKLTVTAANDATAIDIANGKLLVADGATITAGGLEVTLGGASITGTVALDAGEIDSTELAANAVPTLMTSSAPRVSTGNASYNDGVSTTWTNNTWDVGTLTTTRASNLTIYYTAETDVSTVDTVVHVTCNVSDSSNADTADIKFGDYASINQTFSAVFYATDVTDNSIEIKIGYRAAGGGTVGLTNQTLVVVAYPA